jgi:hypothetical protein
MTDSYTPERFPDRQALAAKIGWEGGLEESLDYGITAAWMPEGDDELIAAWTALEAAHAALHEPLKAVRDLLPDDFEG